MSQQIPSRRTSQRNHQSPVQPPPVWSDTKWLYPCLLFLIAIPGLVMSVYSVARLDSLSHTCGRYTLHEFHNISKMPVASFRPTTMISTQQLQLNTFHTELKWYSNETWDLTVHRSSKKPLLYSCLQTSECEFTCTPHPAAQCVRCSSRLRGYVDDDMQLVVSFEARTGLVSAKIASITS